MCCFYHFSRTLAEVLASPCSSRQVYSDLCSQPGKTRSKLLPPQFTHYYVYYKRLQIKAHLGAQIKVFLCLYIFYILYIDLYIINKCLPKILQ